MPILTLASFITKRVNKAVAPKFLQWSLRLFEALPSSSWISPNTLSMLPFAQRLVSIEVQDDYQQIMKSRQNANGNNYDGIFTQIVSSCADFLQQTKNILLESHSRDWEAHEDQHANDVDKKRQRKLYKKQQTNQLQTNPRTFKECDWTSTSSKHWELLEQGEKRVELLQQYLLPALLPTKSTRDLTRPLFMDHQPQTFIKWIRGEYLIAKYGLFVQQAVSQHPELRDDAAGLSISGTQSLEGAEVELPLDMILPSIHTVRKAFGMKDWNQTKAPFVSCEDTILENDETNDIHHWKIDEIIHYRLHGQILFSGPLNAYFEMRRRDDSYELWTKEYIFGLAKYLLQRIEQMDRRYISLYSEKEQPIEQIETVILDVGAGDGRLIYFLRRAMKEILSSSSHGVSSFSGNKTYLRKQIKRKSDKHGSHHFPLEKPFSSIMTLVATDDGSWNAPLNRSKYVQVEQLSVKEALQKYGSSHMVEKSEQKRIIVICSWMPPDQDWTHDFRKPSMKISIEGESYNNQQYCGSVEEYILIGECDDGTCGHNWYTWGNPLFYPQEEHDCNKKVAPFSQDGYTRVDLEDLSLFQMSRFDCKISSESMTVSFRRKS